MNTTFALDETDDLLAVDVSDDVLESAGGMSAGAQAGSSLYSTVSVSGCTC
jgi:hypothetical protein